MRNEYNFTKSKKARDIKHLAELHAIPTTKTRITIMLDDDVIGCFKQQAEQAGIGYQTLINQTLRESLQSNIIKHETISAEMLRKVLREELVLLTKEDPL